MNLYTFPFDSLEVKDSSPILKDISFIKTNENAKIEFDANRGSFLTLGKQAILKLDFNQELIKKEDAKYEINFFIKLNNASDINSIQINDSQAVFNIDELKPEEKTTIITNTWVNVNLSIGNNKMIASIFDSYKKELEIDKMTFLKLLGTENFVSYSQLTINKNGESTKIETKPNKDLSKKIEVNIYTANANVANQLIIEEESRDVFIEIDFTTLKVENIPKEKFIGKLKAKKGLFTNNEKVIIDEVDISTEFQQEFKNNKLVIKLPNIKVANLADQDKALIQVELFDMTLDSILIKEENSLKIDQQVIIIDNRGLNICPFDVFVLGNDTLYNGDDTIPQSIKVAIINTLDNPIELNTKSTFSISSPFQNDILNKDSLHTIEVKIHSDNSLIGLSKFEYPKFNSTISQNVKLSNDLKIKNQIGNNQKNYDNVNLKASFVKILIPNQTNDGWNAETAIRYHISKLILNDYHNLCKGPLGNFIGKKINETFNFKAFDNLVEDLNKNDKNIVKLENIISQVIKKFNNGYFKIQYDTIKNEEKDENIKSKKIVDLVGNISQLLLTNITSNYFDEGFLSTKTINIKLLNIIVSKVQNNNPSGSYPFYLEYKNIPGYRNGKVKFYIKTGKIFYQ